MPLPFEELTRRILEAAFEVSNELGIGFLESVYEGALYLALKAKGMEVERQVPIQVRFRGEAIGQFYADLVVAGKVIVELKAVKALAPEHNAQVLNYLKATGNPVALLLNFGTSKLEFRRFEPRFGKNEQNRDEGDERDSSQ
jgi:GxxExxY protein